MNSRRQQALRLAIFVLFAVSVTSQSYAHFLWLKLVPVNDGFESRLFFSGAADLEGDKLPESVASAEVFQLDEAGKRSQLKMVSPADKKPMRIATLSAAECRSVATTRKYGNYHGTLLTYYAKSVYVTDVNNLAKVSRDKEQKLDMVCESHEGEYVFSLLWENAPLPEIKFTITDAEGESNDVMSGKDGKATFRAKTNGTHGIVAHYEDNDAKGEFDGEKYKGAHHYATLTIPLVADKSSKPAIDDSSKLPSLPVPIASFGAAVVGDFAYVYGGHTGTAHAHSRENLSEGFYRLNLESPKEWKALPSGPALQGLALAAHGKFLYRVGGLDARNAPDEDDDLHSVATAARFNTETLKWEPLPDMPTPRSSHDAFVLGDKLYVVGGWTLSGPTDGEWRNTPLMMDLAAEKLAWEKMSEGPFFKRALAVAVDSDQLYALCGMNDDNDVSRTVFRFDPKTQAWSKGPTLDGGGMDGFGVSACTLDGRVYMSGHDGVVCKLSDERDAWEYAGKLQSGRFFHRLVAHGEKLFAIGGASHTGHMASIESFEPRQEVSVAEKR